VHVWDLSGGNTEAFGNREPAWILLYATVDQPAYDIALALTRRFPGAAVFGATSFQGVLTPEGFRRGAFALAADRVDGVRAASATRASSANRARSDARNAADEIVKALGTKPQALLLHATPGFEERILEGVDEAFEGKAPPLYGGSAADDDLSAKWRVVGNGKVEGEGFVLAGFVSDKPLHGSFVAGYTPGAKRGRVTAASGRRVRTIDGRPAAKVYSEWLGGELDDVVATGGTVLARTSLHPLGRAVDKIGAVPRYLLSHPHEIHADGSLSLFTDVAAGDELVLMVGSRGALVERTDQVAARAGRSAGALRGGILVYCGGCVGAIGDDASTVARRFHERIGHAPYIGAATFGEQGCFTGDKPMNRHGNLMCDAILFE
jgi:hypothetical protein